ncbi:MAG: hypothetical protein DSY76_05815 [Bacteroidetes bacterium]|nr:MAG: hypothetical protein DSY76_05815 [Bacteroidota bacterium]
MEENINKIKSTIVLEMIRIAHEYNTFTEDLKNKKVEDIINFYQKVLPLMYLKASLLPDVEVSDESANERYVTEEHWEEVFMNLKTKFGKADEYWELDDNSDSAKVSLAEKLADCYQDTKDFVVLFQKNKMAAKENAVFEIKRLLKVHWGPRALSALKQLHTILYQEEIDKENEFLL